MQIIGKLVLVVVIASIFLEGARGLAMERAAEEEAGRSFIRNLDKLVAKYKNKATTATWAYDTNITEYNQDQMVKITVELGEVVKELWKELMTYRWQDYEDQDLKRMFEKYSKLGNSALPEDLNEKLLRAVSNMQSTYTKARICDYWDRSKCDLHVESTEMIQIFANSDDPEELKYYWLEWHRVAGAASKGNFTEYVAMNNEAAKLNGFDSVAEWWLAEYEVDDIEDQLASLWAQLKPLYQQIHAYVRRHLRLIYGEDVVSAKGPIPAHLLGNIYAEIWNVEMFTRPYPDKPDVDVTAALRAQNYTALKFFQTAEEFFTSLNLSSMPELFWEKSIIEKPDDGRDLICTASAWDFFDGEDFRVLQCTTITDFFFKTTHNVMSNIQYYLQYKDQPIMYRNAANPGFSSAVGDVIGLSVATPKHLRVMGLLEDGPDDIESNINTLYKMSLAKIVNLPFVYLLDLFRYSVFRGTTTPEDYNCHYWQLRESIQGIEPPAPRTEDDFDPTAKYHISANTECMGYFVSSIMQFQFHRSLCQLAGEYTPGDQTKLLSNCDIYKSTKAGNALGKMLQLGSSKPWPDAMEALTGQRNMDASGVLEYFAPLHDWLKAENELTGEYIGWEPSTVPYCTRGQRSTMKTSGFYGRLRKYGLL